MLGVHQRSSKIQRLQNLTSICSSWPTNPSKFFKCMGLILVRLLTIRVPRRCLRAGFKSRRARAWSTASHNRNQINRCVFNWIRRGSQTWRTRKLMAVRCSRTWVNLSKEANLQKCSSISLILTSNNNSNTRSQLWEIMSVSQKKWTRMPQLNNNFTTCRFKVSVVVWILKTAQCKTSTRLWIISCRIKIWI